MARTSVVIPIQLAPVWADIYTNNNQLYYPEANQMAVSLVNWGKDIIIM